MDSIPLLAVAVPAPEPQDPETFRNIELALHGLYEALDDEELERQNLVFASKTVMRQVELI